MGKITGLGVHTAAVFLFTHYKSVGCLLSHSYLALASVNSAKVTDCLKIKFCATFSRFLNIYQCAICMFPFLNNRPNNVLFLWSFYL